MATELLAVDRVNERENAAAAATTGVSPRILEYLPDLSVMVLEYIDGKTMSGEDLRADGMAARMAESLRRLHAGPRFHQDFNMFRLVEYYLTIVEQLDVLIPEGFYERLPTVSDVERAVAVNALPSVPCHNDLLAENYIDDGRQLWIIDFEYSGNNDPCFELGDTAQECEFDAEAARGAVRGVLRPARPRAARANGASRVHGGRGLDALGGDPGEDLRHRLRLLGLGRGTLGQSRHADGLNRVPGLLSEASRSLVRFLVVIPDRDHPKQNDKASRQY